MSQVQNYSPSLSSSLGESREVISVNAFSLVCEWKHFQLTTLTILLVVLFYFFISSFFVHPKFYFVFFLFCKFLGSSLTPLTPIPISDVNKSSTSASSAAAMLQGPTISVLGDHNTQFQTGTNICHPESESFTTEI